MKQKLSLLILGAALLSGMLLAGCAPFQAVFHNPRYTYENGAVLVRGDDRPIELKNNPQAADVSYAELLEFIRGDLSDQWPYVARGSVSGMIPFVCSDFAEMVHNNAEDAGIRAGYMTIQFFDSRIGHAVNVFQTLDMGLVYIDCTGKSDYSQLEEDAFQEPVSGWDKVAYVEVGKKYGVITLDKALSPDYAFFEQFEQEWQVYRKKLAAYNSEVKQFNREISGKVYRPGSPEMMNVRAWKARLEQEESDLVELGRKIGTISFKPLGIVKSINLHW